MKISQCWVRNVPTTIHGESITLTTVYSSFDKTEIDELQQKMQGGVTPISGGDMMKKDTVIDWLSGMIGTGNKDSVSAHSAIKLIEQQEADIIYLKKTCNSLIKKADEMLAERDAVIKALEIMHKYGETENAVP